MRARRNTLIATVLCVAFFMLGLPVPAAHATSSCANPVACENQLPGTPQSVWDDGTDDQTILGFATQMSVNVGGNIAFKVNTNAKAYTVDIFRMGYYQGNGARKITTVPVSVPLPQSQPACLRDTATDLFDCGGWAVSASWQVPSTAVPGVYFAQLTRTDTGGRSQIFFVVRDDTSHSTIVFQTSDTTWQAYNTYGGASLYQGVNQSRGYKVSYNRPFIDRDGVTARDYVYANEYPTIRFLEANGYDVSYISGLDIAMGQGNLTNHRIFMSVGHDEYWSASQRNAVTQARDAGVNLMFLSGNEVYWHTRWENSIDGTNTPYRTMVCYKDTKESAQIDPVSPTPTWRDPRYAGFNPENSLSGTMYTGQGTNLPLQVTSDQGKLRVWRNTGLSSMSPGSTATLGSDLVGYEMDSTVDNGYQPAGQIAVSTTTASVPEVLTDFGNNVAPGTLTNHLSYYKAASGALVFSSGSIQFAWGLDGTHDLSTHDAIPQVQQLTVNILADMGAQPTSLQAGLVQASASADTTAPVVSIASPASSTTIAYGTQVTVSGTVTDAGGIAAGVEVSVDGGGTWHPATGIANWSYTGPLRAYGANAIRVRATDDSLNTSTPVSPAGLAVTGPNSVFGDWVPATPDSGDTSATTLGMIFTPNTDGFISGVRFYKSTANTGTHTGTLFSSTGAVIATGTFTGETASGWQQLTFPTPVTVTAGTKYVVAYYAPAGHYAYSSYFFSPSGLTSADLTAVGGLGVANGVYASGNGYPNQSYHQSNYFVDVLFTSAANSPLSAFAISPVIGAGSTLTTATVVGQFSKDPGDMTMAISLSAAGGVPVAGTSTYDPVSHQITFAPSQALAYATTFTATITDANLATPYSWSFTTVAAPRVAGVCPCTFFQDTDQPSSFATNDSSSVALGVQFSPTKAGTLLGIRWWKPLGQTSGQPVTLYGPTGTALATATASSETTVGWQYATFSTPVTVTVGALYTAAVQFPTGGYPYAYGVFSSTLTVGPLTAQPGAGRYVYGTGMPTNSVTTSYFVDPVFQTAPSVPPVVASASPGNGARSVPINGSVTLTFNEPIATGSATVTMSGPAGPVSGTVTGTSTTRTFTPSSPLAENTTYTVNESGAVTTDNISQTQAFSESFTTSGVASCPCSLLETTLSPVQPNLSNGSAITLGLKFSPTVNGYIDGLRYWRAASNTGTHTGKLYAANGTVLASLTFVDGAEGWQQALFSAPVAVTAGTPYFASYYSPNGTYSATTNVFTTVMSNPPLQSVDAGGVYGSGDVFPNQSFGAPNYFVDVVFTTSGTLDTPSVASVSPATGATGVAVTSPVTVTFSGPLNTASISVAVAPQGGTAVAGTLSVSGSTATFTPSAALAGGTTYTVTVNASGPGGTAMAPFTSTFATQALVTVASTSPAANATGVAVTSPVTVNFSGPLATSSVVITLTPSGGTAVAGTLTTTSTSATFTPTASLAQSTVYNATVSASSTSGTAMTPVTWSFSTVSPAPVISSQSPVANATAVPANTSVSVTFTGSVDPTKSTLTLKTSSGVAVSGTLTTTSTNVTFKPSALLAASTTYTATVGASSVLGTVMTPSSWSFTTESAPTVSAISPANGATSVTNNTTVRATFSKAVNQASIVITVTDPSGAVVPGTLTTTSTTGTFTPSSLLTPGTLYKVAVSAALADGLATPAFSSTFTTGAAVDLFPATVTPTSSTQTTSPLTVGVKFRSTTRYWITGIQFYLPANWTSTYTVTLWSNGGTKLATGSGSPTSATAGWRTVNLTTPYRIVANTTYVATVRALTGQYSSTPNAFTTAYTNGTLSVPASGGVTATNDVFPTATSTTNYFVDVVAAP